ncbi:MAG TPA: hypothetical protein VGD45_21025 [Steroidobacter sp.]|uniref:hypothetical protein n=1 Tax=Steroidobacter sp. TaxID=1978227 RepID=UPI002ED951D4
MDTWLEVAATLENEINEVMDQAYPHDWDENFLSRQLLRSIQGCLQTRPYVRGTERVRISMECYKLTGRREATFGDIGLLISVIHKAAKPVTGAAYLEAKRRRPHTTQFPEFRQAQLKRILKAAPKAQLLLYDYEPSTQFVGPLGYHPWQWGLSPLIASHVSRLPCANVRVVPIDTALAAGVKDTRLYPFGTTLSLQLIARYFCGLDLEFAPACVESLKGNGALLPKRLAVIRVVEGGGQVDGPEINPNIFVREDD